MPDALRRELEPKLRTPLDTVRVERGPAATADVDRAAARAATTDQIVKLPSHQGPAATEPARSLLAHELVHVAQQRGRPHPPAEDTPEGHRMERVARTVERVVEQRGPAAPLALAAPSRPRPTQAVTPPDRPTPPLPMAPPAGPGPEPVDPTPAPAPAAPSGTQRAPRIESVSPPSETSRSPITPSPAQLADELFPHLRRMLADELLDHRERTGGNLS